jgi:hypothetical protein
VSRSLTRVWQCHSRPCRRRNQSIPFVQAFVPHEQRGHPLLDGRRKWCSNGADRPGMERRQSSDNESDKESPSLRLRFSVSVAPAKVRRRLMILAYRSHQWLPFPTTSYPLPLFVSSESHKHGHSVSFSETADPRFNTKRYSAQRPKPTFSAVNHEGPCPHAYTHGIRAVPNSTNFPYGSNWQRMIAMGDGSSIHSIVMPGWRIHGRRRRFYVPGRSGEWGVQRLIPSEYRRILPARRVSSCIYSSSCCLRQQEQTTPSGIAAGQDRRVPGWRALVVGRAAG